MSKIQKNIFLNMKTSKIKSEKNIYQTIHNTRFIFYFFGIFTIFLYFSRFFENLNSILWKNYNFVLSFLHTATCNIWGNWYFSTHLWYTRVCGKIQIHPNIASGGVQERQNQNISWIKWNHTVQMVLVDPCDKLIICFLWPLKGGKHNSWCNDNI